ncbi:MAG: DUF853 family protein [Methanobacteriota archaeon]|nr:MAG: DUF853 family protein [Euryarchaeota archaeon]
MSDGKLHVGYTVEGNEKIELPVKTLKRHFAALGASGSGKTVFVKAVMEECIREGIPLLIVDIQGDLASLALMGDKKLMESKGVPGSYWDEIKEKAQVAIFTPASTKGIPISMNPLKAPPEGMDYEDFIQAVDSVAEAVASIIGYNTEKGKGKDVHSYLYLLLESLWENGEQIGSFDHLAQAITEEKYLSDADKEILKDKDKEELIKQVKSLTIGADSLIFNLGMALDVEKMMNWADKGKVPVNVLYLNTIRDDDTKKAFIADIANQTYNYMLRNPSEDVQLVFLLDELAGLVPPIGNPPTKKSIQLLLKQARKYGVSLLLATQNVSDVDYKSLGQVGTWALGRLMAKQDIEKVKAIIEAISPKEVDEITTKIRKLKTGQFMLLAPDVYDKVQFMQVRWLATNHTTLDEERVKRVMDESGLRDKFPKGKLGRRRGKKTKEEAETKDSEEMKTLEEELREQQVEQETDDLAGIPQVEKIDDLLSEMEEQPLALSIEDVSVQLNIPEKEAKKELDKLAKSKKLVAEEIDGVKYYWSKKHDMDPANNIIGPLFRIHLEIPKGKAQKIVEKNIPKDLWKKREEIIENRTELYYVPLWRISALEREIIKKGGLFKKKEVIQKDRKVFYYIHAINGSIAHLDLEEKEPKLYFKSSGIVDKKDVNTLDSRPIFDKEVRSGLSEKDLLPKLSREKATRQLVKLISARVDRSVVPALVWFPIWSFVKWDDAEEKETFGWVDGVYGTYYDQNPLE